jgi:hypothetical protein
MNKYLLYPLVIFWSLLPLSIQAEFIISHRGEEGFSNKYFDYYTALITLALEKTRSDYGDYRMQRLGILDTERTLYALAADQYPNLIMERSYDEASTTSSKLTYINFPVDGGIVGYRVCFVNPAVKEKISKIKTLAELRHYTIVQGIGWADTLILRHNGFKVLEIDNYASLFKMTTAGRADLFCRGANEIMPEYEVFKDIIKLYYDESFVLYYPLPRFFYLNSKSKLAKKRIEAGLKLAYHDGSFKKLWRQHYQPSIDFAKLNHRKLFRLENPLLKKLPKDYLQYFFNPIEAASYSPEPHHSQDTTSGERVPAPSSSNKLNSSP